MNDADLIEEARRVNQDLARNALGERVPIIDMLVDRLRDLLAAHDAEVRARFMAEREPEWEYGVEYDVSSTETVFTAAHSEAMARKWVEESPTDTGLRRRRPAGPWLPVEENEEIK
jgi:hypothetical protein